MPKQPLFTIVRLDHEGSKIHTVTALEEIATSVEQAKKLAAEDWYEAEGHVHEGEMPELVWYVDENGNPWALSAPDESDTYRWIIFQVSLG